MSIIKSDIIEAVQSKNDLSKKQSKQAVESIIDRMKKTLASGEDILISGFGKFCVHEKNERGGRNPATGEDLMLSPRKVVTFKCSGKLRKKINDTR